MPSPPLRRLAAVGVAAAALFTALTQAVAAQPPPAREESWDRLTVTLGGRADDPATGVGTPGGRAHTLRCHPAGGDHPDPQAACERLDALTIWGRDLFAAGPPDALCTSQYGGSATAHVTGSWAGRPVDARFSRHDGCEIARWDAFVPLLPPADAVRARGTGPGRTAVTPPT